MPELDDEVGRAHELLIRDVIDARRVLDRLAVPVALDVAQLRGRAFVRVGAVLGVLVAGGVAAAWLARPAPPSVAVSAVWSNAADRGLATLTDGDPETSWLLPDRTAGWVELRFPTPRRVAALRLMNTYNGSWQDRGAKDFEIEVYAGSRRVKAVAGAFRFLERGFKRVAIDVEGVTRIRVNLKTHHRTGAGLAEIAVD